MSRSSFGILGGMDEISKWVSVDDSGEFGARERSSPGAMANEAYRMRSASIRHENCSRLPMWHDRLTRTGNPDNILLASSKETVFPR